jgi:hypothetical protein
MDRPEKRNAPGLATRGISEKHIAAVTQRTQSSAKSTPGAIPPCYCGTGRQAGLSYICVTCARFVGIGKKIAARSPYLYAERRVA